MQDPMPLGRYAKLPLSEITVRASRSSGPGGQHANVTASRIEAVFDVETSEALSQTHKQRIIGKLGPRVVAISQDARSQAQNRELALGRLQERLTAALYVAPPRRPTRPTRASVARGEEGKRIQAERKRRRRPPSSDD
ncbi:MAG TPA: peptide chain release factor-like protein [Solirubrobacteraceae bacterium]|nr:peptide chain release factor-like protein [Solirubrobacteraceae bacterium]